VDDHHDSDWLAQLSAKAKEFWRRKIEAQKAEGNGESRPVPEPQQEYQGDQDWEPDGLTEPQADPPAKPPPSPPPAARDTCHVRESEDDPHRLARLFRSDHMTAGGLGLRFWQDGWWRWDGCAYRSFPDKELRADFTELVKRNFDERNLAALALWEASKAGEGGKESPAPTARKVTTRLVSDALQALTGMTVLPSATEPPAWIGKPDATPPQELLVCLNTMVHLPEWVRGRGGLHPLTPRFFTLNSLDFAFDAHAPSPCGWLRFLRELWPEDHQSIETLQEWAGYTMLPDTSLQKILLLLGPKRSGKGTISRVLQRLIGLANVCGPTLGSLATPFGLQPLLGKTLAIVSDARLSHRTDSAVIAERLLAVSGEDTITVDRKHLLSVTCKLPTRFMLLSNELPRLADASGALAGRMILLRLTRSFYGKEDPTLTAKLTAELPGILLWAVEGWRRLKERGRFAQPESAQAIIQDLEDLGSPISAFVRERCEVGPGCEVAVKELFASWKSWCETVGKKEPGSEQTFGRDLRAAVPGLDDRKPRVNGSRVRIYVGIRLRELGGDDGEFAGSPLDR